MRQPASGVLYPLVVHTGDISPVAVPYLIKTSTKLAVYGTSVSVSPIKINIGVCQ